MRDKLRIRLIAQRVVFRKPTFVGSTDRSSVVVYNLDTKTGRTTVIDDKEFSENFLRQTVEHESQSDKEKRLRCPWTW
jgi:hypothetical protein